MIDAIRAEGIASATGIAVFPKGKHDDQVDSTAQFLDWYKRPFPTQGYYEYMRQRLPAAYGHGRVGPHGG